MNIFEAMFKGCGKAILPEMSENTFCYMANGCFLWEDGRLEITKKSYRVKNEDLIRNDWKPYTEEIKKCSCQDRLNMYEAYVVTDKYGFCIICGRLPKFNQKVESKAPHETISGQSKYHNIVKTLEDIIDESVRYCNFYRANSAIETLALVIKLGYEWPV